MIDRKNAAATTAPAVIDAASIVASSSKPMTRQQILDKLAEAARQKRAARLVGAGADDDWTQQAAQVVRSWLSE